MRILPPLFLVAVGFNHDGRYELVTHRVLGVPVQVLNLVESSWAWEWENTFATIARVQCMERAGVFS